MTGVPAGGGPPVAFHRPDGDGPGFWFGGTHWRMCATGQDTGGLLVAMDEFCPRGLAAPLHVHEDEDEAFFVLDGRFTFYLGEQEIPADPGSYVYLPRGIRHGFRVESDYGRVFNTLTPAGFERPIMAMGEPSAGRPLPPDPSPADVEVFVAAARRSAAAAASLMPPGAPHPGSR